MARQKTTSAPDPNWTLSPEQLAAVDLLASGKSVSETAGELAVDPQTVSQWWTQHYGVQAALNARRQAQWGEQMYRLRALLPKALDVLTRELEGDNPLPAAIHVLKACRLYGTPMVQGPTEVEDIAIAAQERAQARERKALVAGMSFNGRFS
jgi:transposase-like protein